LLINAAFSFLPVSYDATFLFHTFIFGELWTSCAKRTAASASLMQQQGKE